MSATASGSGAAPIGQKVEIRFEKGEAVRFISHHDLLRAFQRAVRRAGLPVRLTEGFNPRPRMVFPVALEVGIASHDEAVEIELTQWIPLEELRTRLAESLPPGFRLLSLRELQPVRKGQAPLRTRFRLHLAERGPRVSPERVAELLTAPALPFLRTKGGQAPPPPPLEVDLRPCLANAAVEDDGALVVELNHGPLGQARPLEILSLLTGMPVANLKLVRVTKLRMDLQPQPKPETPPQSKPPEPPEPRPPR